MVSEKNIAKLDESLWETCAPILTKKNKNSFKSIIINHAKRKKFANLFISRSPAYYNDLVAEISFAHCAKNFTNTPYLLDSIVQRSIERINILSGKQIMAEQLSCNELKDAIDLSKRLKNFLISIGGDKSKFHPHLFGYGYLNSCYPDIIVKKILIEVKSSNYAYRLQDYRQIFLYFFLAIKNNLSINTLMLVNPRFGETLIINGFEYLELMTQMSYSKAIDKLSRFLLSN